MSIHSQISLIASLFKARIDIFALRWDNGRKSGYSPAYRFDPYRYKLHKIKGGNFSEYSDKELQPLTDEQILIINRYQK